MPPHLPPPREVGFEAFVESSGSRWPIELPAEDTAKEQKDRHPYLGSQARGQMCRVLGRSGEVENAFVTPPLHCFLPESCSIFSVLKCRGAGGGQTGSCRLPLPK